MDKKAQVEVMFNWFVALALCFAILLFFMLWVKPWQKIDHEITPKIDHFTAGGKSSQTMVSQARRNQGLVPVLIMSGVVLIAFLASLKQDPNYPYQ